MKLLTDKNKVLNVIRRYAFMVLGCISYALSLRLFLIPNNVVAGGISGAATLIEIVSNHAITAGVCIILLNIPIILLGYKIMGKVFIIRCFITTATLALCTDLLEKIIHFEITDNLLLVALYAGILQGIGIGLFIKFGMSSGGTELLGRIINHRFQNFSIATYTAVFDGIIVLLGAIFTQNPESVLYVLILVFVSARTSNLLIMGLNKTKLCYIITTKAEEIGDFLISHSPRGVTLINGEGMYSKTPKGVLLTCVRNNQFVALKNAVKLLDESAFVIVCDAHEVYGKGFSRI